MPYAFVPLGYKAVLIGQAPDIEDLGAFAPLEEVSGEGTLVLMRLDFLEPISEETLIELEQACRNAGIEPWPGSEFYVYADTDAPSVYLVWQKGFAWLPIIVGLLATMILPSLLTAGIWLILPDSLKNLISSLINMVMMILMMWLVMKMMSPLLSEKKKPKQVTERAS